MKRVHLLYLLGILAIGVALLIALRPPSLSPYHPFVGTWELERGSDDSFQRIILAPRQRVIINGAVQGEFTASPAIVTIHTDNVIAHHSIEMHRDRLYLYQNDALVFVYRRINNCWTPLQNNICE
jgi:hypothetical protein